MNIADIAALALNAVQPVITDAVQPVTLSRTTQGDYDIAAGAYTPIIHTQTGRAVFQDVGPAAKIFAPYVPGPADELILLEGMTSVQENDTLMIAGKVRTVRMARDIGGASSLFNVIAR